jgi:hypothetical protein
MKRQLGLLLALTLILIAALGSGGAFAEGSGGHVANLRIGTTAPNNTFNALTQKDAFGRMNYNGLTQSNFVYRDADNLLKPYFWKSFEISADGTSIAFTFPLDAVWHDGQPVTWDDIEFTFQYMRDVRKVSTLQHLIKSKRQRTGAGLLTFDQPDAYYWLNSSCMNNACVYPKHIWQGVEDIDGYAGEDAAVGSGPYKLVSFDKEAQTSYYEAVPQNAFLGELTVDSVTLQTYSGEDTLVMAMLNGEIDCMFNYANPIDASIIDLVMENPDIDPGKSDFSGCYQLEYGKERAPGSDEAFRQALAYAWNYPLLAATINGEYGQIPGRGIIPPSCKGYDETLAKLEYDVEKARPCWTRQATRRGRGRLARPARRRPDGPGGHAAVQRQHGSAHAHRGCDHEQPDRGGRQKPPGQGYHRQQRGVGEKHHRRGLRPVHHADHLRHGGLFHRVPLLHVGASGGADLLVVGHRARRGIHRRLLRDDPGGERRSLHRERPEAAEAVLRQDVRAGAVLGDRLLPLPDRQVRRLAELPLLGRRKPHDLV